MIAFVQIGVRGGELGDRLVEPVALAKVGRDRLPMRFIAWRRAGCVERSGDELAIAGDITIKGHTGPVELKATITEPIADPYGGMRILGISGSLRRDSYNTALLRHAGRVVRLRVRSSSSIPASAKSPRSTRTKRSTPHRPSSPTRSNRRSRRRLLRHPRVQLVDPRRSRERARLGVTTDSDEHHPQQAGRSHGSKHQWLRSE
jgi:hypothetical protein